MFLSKFLTLGLRLFLNYSRLARGVSPPYVLHDRNKAITEQNNKCGTMYISPYSMRIAFVLLSKHTQINNES